MVNLNRVRQINTIDFPKKPGVVVYWMNRDQRVRDNWAFLFAQEIAIKNELPLAVIFEIVPNFNPIRSRIYQFMLSGLQQVEQELASLKVPLILLESGSDKKITDFVNKYNIFTLVTDFSPLKSTLNTREEIKHNIKVPFYEVDSHNIVPCWITSIKAEYGAYTIRPKITALLDQYLTDFPAPQESQVTLSDSLPENDWDTLIKNNVTGFTIPTKYMPPSGSSSALTRLTQFISNGLDGYNKYHNNPNVNGQSGLSPYLHFGQISPQRVAFEIQSAVNADPESKASFLEELIIRRELADNFCFFNLEYDSFEAFPDWAQKSLLAHNFDKREYFYGLAEFESGKTHDPLWNAAQSEMVKTGKMHGYLRMYWAKKILEWTISPRDALQIAISLNDKYSLDGSDPNGYAGIAWSIGGVHDRPWFDRPIFGQVRYMSYDGCASKFDVNQYIQRISSL